MPRGVYDRAKLKTKPKAPAPRAPHQPRTPPMPDVKTKEAADRVTANAYETGTYELQPQFKNRQPPKGVVGNPLDEPAPDLTDVSPTPAHLIRMVHPDGGVADGLQVDSSGAVLVPFTLVETLRSHGFVVEHLPQPEPAPEMVEAV